MSPIHDEGEGWSAIPGDVIPGELSPIFEGEGYAHFEGDGCIMPGDAIPGDLSPIFEGEGYIIEGEGRDHSEGEGRDHSEGEGCIIEGEGRQDSEGEGYDIEPGEGYDQDEGDGYLGADPPHLMAWNFSAIDLRIMTHRRSPFPPLPPLDGEGCLQAGEGDIMLGEGREYIEGEYIEGEYIEGDIPGEYVDGGGYIMLGEGRECIEGDIPGESSPHVEGEGRMPGDIPGDSACEGTIAAISKLVGNKSNLIAAT